MSKPSFLQSVLGRPSRRYSEQVYDPSPTSQPADPYNPYKGYASNSLPRSTSSHLSYATDGGHPFDQDRPGPSRRRPAVPVGGDFAAHRGHHFPSHSSALAYAPRHGQGIALDDHHSETDSTLGYARSDLGLGLPPGTSPYAPARSYSRSGRRNVSDGSAAHSLHQGHYSSQQYDATPQPPMPYVRQVHVTNAPRHHYEYQYEYDYEPSPPLSNVSSVINERGQAPRRPALPTFSQYDAFKPQPPTPARTPPSSVPSSLTSAAENGPGANVKASSRSGAPRTCVDSRELPKRVSVEAPVIVAATLGDMSDSEDDVFYTPRSSLDMDNNHNADDDLTTPVSEVTVLPTFQLQPPTPMNDPTTPPLERSLHEMSLRASLLSPNRAQGVSQPIVETENETDTETETEYVEPTLATPVTEVDETVQETQHAVNVTPPRTKAKTRSPKTTRARSSSITSTSSDGIPPPVPPKSRGGRVRGAQVTVLKGSNPLPPIPHEIPKSSQPLRRSRSAKSLKTKATTSSKGHPSRPPFGAEFRTVSEVGTASAAVDRRRSSGSVLSDVSHARSLDGGVRTAGYGKGGWAAASATPVVMYMPSNGKDGWAAFQPLPPRSRFSVLPGSQVSQHPGQHSFESGSTGSSSLAPSASASQEGRRPSYHSQPAYSPPNGRSSPTSGNFHSLPFQRRYEPSALSRSSSPFTSPPLPAPSPIPSSQIRPAFTPPGQTDSDDDWDGEQPSRSYVQQKPPPPPPSRPYDYGSDVAASSRSISTPSSRTPSVVRFQGLDEPEPQPEPQPKVQRWIPPAAYDPYNDQRTAQPFRRQSVPVQRVQSPTRIHPGESSASSAYSSPPSLSKHTSLSASANASSYGSEPLRLPQMPVFRSASPQAIMSETAPSTRRANLGPSSINPDLLTFLPEMSAAASDALYNESESGHRRHGSDGVRRSRSLKSFGRVAKSDIGGDRVHERDRLARNLSMRSPTNGVISLDGPESGTMAVSDILMESHGRELRGNGYTNLILPRGGSYNPVTNPIRELTRRDPRMASLPHTSMAAIALTSSLMSSKRFNESATPAHLRHNLPSLVDFTSHISPPTKVGDREVMVQVYAVAVDSADIAALDERGVADVGKFIPGRSFVGRLLVIGDDEKDLQRGDLVMGLLDIKKSGALCEYIVTDRRRVARVPSSDLSLEQLALLPAQGITTLRALRGILARGAQAVIMDAHEGVPALMCQEMARRGVIVTTVIPDTHRSVQDDIKAKVLAHGASGGLVGSPAAALMSLDEAMVHLVVDTRGGTKVTQAAKRALVDGGHLLTLIRDGNASSPTSTLSFRNAFKRRVGDAVVLAGTGEPNVDSSGLDCRDVLEEPAMEYLVPVVGRVVPFERGAELFVAPREPGTVGGVVRIIN